MKANPAIIPVIGIGVFLMALGWTGRFKQVYAALTGESGGASNTADADDDGIVDANEPGAFPDAGANSGGQNGDLYPPGVYDSSGNLKHDSDHDGKPDQNPDGTYNMAGAGGQWNGRGGDGGQWGGPSWANAGTPPESTDQRIIGSYVGATGGFRFGPVGTIQGRAGGPI